jgi:hypothetical protein
MEDKKKEKKDSWNMRAIALVIGLGVVILILLAIIFWPKEKTTNLPPPTPPKQTEVPRATTPSSYTTFCFRLDGREDMHLPALLGASASDVYPNGVDGYNWSLPATATGKEPYGILPNGSVFVKKDYLKKWSPATVEIKSQQTGWRPVTMVAEEINGETAYVYRP